MITKKIHKIGAFYFGKQLIINSIVKACPVTKAIEAPVQACVLVK